MSEITDLADIVKFGLDQESKSKQSIQNDIYLKWIEEKNSLNT